MVQVQVMPKVGLNMMHSSTVAVISYIGKQMDHKCKGLQLFTLVSAFAFVFTMKPANPAANDETVCLPALPPFKNQPGHDVLEKGVQAIFPNLEIKCTGHITSWKAYTRHAEPNSIQFQVWRPDSNDGSYSLVGRNTLSNEKPVMEVVTLNVQSADNVQVQPGDVIGLYQGNSGRGQQIRTKPDPNSMWYFKTTGAPAIGFKLHLSNAMLVSSQHIPIITLTIEESIPAVEQTIAKSMSSSPQTRTTVLEPTFEPVATPSRTNTAGSTDTSTESPISDSVDQNNENCNSGEFMFPLLVVLVMTIAILLLVVFILGTALVLVSLRLRNVREGASQPNISTNTSEITNSVSNEIDGPVSTLPVTNGTENKILGQLSNQHRCNAEFINSRNNYNLSSKRDTYDRQRSILDSCDARKRTDTQSSTMTNRGFCAQEYEHPHDYAMPQYNDQVQTVSTSTVSPYYSHPRTMVNHTTGRIPIECNVSYNDQSSRYLHTNAI